MARDIKQVFGDRAIRPAGVVFGYFISLCIGILFLILGSIILSNGLKYKLHGEEVEAIVTKVVENEEERSIYIKYNYNGVDYENKLGYWNEELDLDSVVKILVLKDNPEDFSAKSDYVSLSILVLIIGLVVTGMAVFDIAKHYKEKYRIYHLLKDGYVVKGKVECVEAINTRASFGHNAWELSVTYEDKVFNSTRFWITAPLYEIKGGMIDVYVDKDNSENYYVDLWSVNIQKYDDTEHNLVRDEN